MAKRAAVAGGGIMGLFTARSLVNRGWQVDLYDPRPLNHTEGSSHGRSRIVRRAYPDPYYTEIMLEGYPLWAELEADCGEQVVHESGLVMFGRAGDEELERGIQGLRDLGVTHERLEGAGLHQRLPGMRFGESEFGFFTPEAGWVNADRTREIVWRLAEGGGATLIPREFDPGESGRYDACLVCAGPWITRFASLPVSARLMTFAHFDAASPGPVWICHSEGYPYGFPDDSGRVKIGIHRPGLPFDPIAGGPREPEAAAIAELERFADQRLGSGLRAVEPTTCLYTMAPNDDFLLGELEGWDCPAWFASPCSGHGFKFAPWIGLTLARFAEGSRTPGDYPRFAFTGAHG